LIEENRAILLGTPGNPGGAANWVQGAKSLTLFLMIFQVPLFIFAFKTIENKYTGTGFVTFLIMILLTMITAAKIWIV
jgi:uncharacterized membrane-anchored protein YitT (DUF2179 family)